MIFQNLGFPHIKSMFEKRVKNVSFFLILPYQILDHRKTTFFEKEKKPFFGSKIFSRGRMALKTCGKDPLENS